MTKKRTAPPSTPEERELEHAQRVIAKGDLARRRRDVIAFSLWQGGMTQSEIAERLDRADRAGGGGGVTHAAAQKLLFRFRKAREARMA